MMFSNCGKRGSFYLLQQEVARGSESSLWLLVSCAVPATETDRNTPADHLVRSAGCKLWADSDRAARWQWVGFVFYQAFLVYWVLYTQQRQQVLVPVLEVTAA
jgi:hypothetical protein